MRFVLHISVDLRGNVTESTLRFNAPFSVSVQSPPYAANDQFAVTRCGVELQTVSVSCVTNAFAYDALGRKVATTDGRGNTTRTEYNALGQQTAAIDALGNRTEYAYDEFGSLASVTDPLGNATVYEYDLQGRKTYEGGATYPVRYTYDIFGNLATLSTTRDPATDLSTFQPFNFSTVSWDTTTWLYDEASGAMTNKVYADGKGPTYDYTPNGRLARRTWARGIVTDYAYDGWGNLTNTAYSDDTQAVSLSYDAMGRQIEAQDAAGTTTFAYDAYGALTNETAIGVAGTNTIERYWDVFGRTAGYALNGERQTTISYDSATGRIASMLAAGSDDPFSWSYLPGSDQKSSLAYPNGLTASWQYDANDQLLQVRNASPTNVISQYDYTYDAAGRRISCRHSGSAFTGDDTISYGYDIRGELTNALAAVAADYRYAYQYDCIGNRFWSSKNTNCAEYVANCLNQYTAISNFIGAASIPDVFSPQYDDDGNQTLIKTATGIWSVIYNGENRPIMWSNGIKSIIMSYDRLGRRVMKNSQHFVYYDYVQIEDKDTRYSTYIWDSTEPNAPRLLVWSSDASTSYYFHDGNKNVSSIISMTRNFKTELHYDYYPFGQAREMVIGPLLKNHWRYSSEYDDDDLCLIYFNYRHYNPNNGKWLTRDCIDELGAINLYSAMKNDPINNIDFQGMLLTPAWFRIFFGTLAKARDAVNKAQKCMNTTREAFRRRDKGFNDKLNHCLSSCEISIDCGTKIADALGCIKEARDLTVGYLETIVGWFIPKGWEEWIHDYIQGGTFQDSVDDFVANFTGFNCKDHSKGCKCCCKGKYK